MQILTLKDNDALHQLTIITGKKKRKLEEIINYYFVNEGLMYEDDHDVYGYSVQQIVEQNPRFNITEVVKNMFQLRDYREAIELMTSIFFHNDLNDCIFCGCETIKEIDGDEIRIKCTNFCC